MPRKSWIAKNPEKYRAYNAMHNAQWKADHPQEVKAYLAWYRAQPENQAKRRAYENERDKRLRAEAAAEREKIPKAPPAPLSTNPKTVKRTEYMREWRKRNPDMLREHKRINQHNRRIAKQGGKFTLAEWRATIERQNGLCFDCGERRRMTIGHLVPLAKGGTHTAANIVAQCMACNHKQGVSIHPSIGD